MYLALVPSLYRLIAVSALASVLLVLHVKLAWRTRRDGPRFIVPAWLVPGAGAFFAWRKGERIQPISYVTTLVAYLVLLLTA